MVAMAAAPSLAGNVAIDKNLVEQFAGIFQGRTDAWGTVNGSCQHESVTIEHYRKHLEGRVSLGVYPMLSDDTCWWGAHDYDHEDAETPLALLAALGDLGVNRGVYLERTKSFHWRVWLLLDAPVLAPRIRHILKAAITKAGAPPATEVFPKQDTLAGLDVGNYVNIPYWPKGRGRAIVDPQTLAPVPLEAFLASVTRFPVGVLDLLDLPPEPPAKAYVATSRPVGGGGWHPCAETFLSIGGAQGNRNGSLFTFCKHLHAMELPQTIIEQLTLSANAQQTPPLPQQEVVQVMASALNGKSGAGYTSLGCEDPLWAPFYCSPEAKARCKVVHDAPQDGVIAGENFSITTCTMQRSRPPVFTLTVNNMDVTLSREQLMVFQKFRAVVGPEIKRYPLLPKKISWDVLVDKLFQTMGIIEAPEDASESSAVLELINRYLYTSSYAEDVRDMHATGRPLLDEGGTVFTGEGIARFLERAGVKINRAHLWHLMHSLGAEQTVRKQDQKRYRCWCINSGTDESNQPGGGTQ